MLKKDEFVLGNSCALNVLYNGVDKNIFRLINTCKRAQEAWKILKFAHEGTSKLRSQRLQFLTTKFETTNMLEEETIS